MLITCDGCGAKIRVPDSAAGKRVKCPKCAHVLQVPAPDPSKEEPNAEATKVSARPMPPPPPIEEEPLQEEEKTRVTSSGAKPPKVKSKPARSIDDDDDGDDEPVRKRRRWDEGEDDYLDVRSSRSKAPKNSMATTAMVLGFVSLGFGTVGVCCCSIFGPAIAILCGGLAVLFGFMGRVPGSESTALTGIICGGIGLTLGLIILALWALVIGIDLAGQGGAFNFNPQG